jgi:hypothetical protein
MRSEAATLLPVLQRWQAALPRLAGKIRLEDIACTDAALQRLIDQLQDDAQTDDRRR